MDATGASPVPTALHWRHASGTQFINRYLAWSHVPSLQDWRVHLEYVLWFDPAARGHCGGRVQFGFDIGSEAGDGGSARIQYDAVRRGRER